MHFQSEPSVPSQDCTNARTQHRVRRRQRLVRVTVADTTQIRGPQTDLVIGEAAAAAAAPTRGGEMKPVPKPPDANASIEIYMYTRTRLSARTLRFSKAFGAWSVRRRQRGRRARSGPHSAQGPTRGSPPAHNQPRTLSLCRQLPRSFDRVCIRFSSRTTGLCAGAGAPNTPLFQRSIGTDEGAAGDPIAADGAVPHCSCTPQFPTTSSDSAPATA